MDDWERSLGRSMREIPREGNLHAFLLKALREASGELEGEFYNLRPKQLSWRENGEWSLIEIAGHLRDREEANLAHLRAIVGSRRPRLDLVDYEALVEDNGYEPRQINELLYGYSDLRQRALYLLYNLSENQWRRAGQHPYRGELTIEQLAKEMNEHDLAHLWQIQRVKGLL
jgi:hypothetical protein